MYKCIRAERLIDFLSTEQLNVVVIDLLTSFVRNDLENIFPSGVERDGNHKMPKQNTCEKQIFN